MPTWKEQTLSIDALRSQRDQLDQQLYINNLLLQQKQDQLKKMLSTNPKGDPQLQEQVKQLQATLDDNRNKLTVGQKNVDQAISAFYAAAGPQELVQLLPDNIPFALLPVRLETRFNIIDNSNQPGTPGLLRGTPGKPAAAAQSELWVRIYPDDIAIITHEKTLTDQEVTGGESTGPQFLMRSNQEQRVQKIRRKRPGAIWSVPLVPHDQDGLPCKPNRLTGLQISPASMMSAS